MGNISYSLSLRWVKDTTLRGRKSSQEDLAKGIYYYFGIAPNAAWLLDNDNYIDKNQPAFSITKDSTVFPEFSSGLLWKNSKKKGHRSIFNISYGKQALQKEGFGKKVSYKNNSISLDVFQSFWNYHGFVPFLGLSYSINQLTFETDTQTEKQNKNVIGAIFGWDIMPNHDNSWYLRTALRYYPKVALTIANEEEILFPNFEFQFIQYVYQF